MSSSDRRSFLLTLAALPLAGCGFSPAYAPGAPAAELQGRVRIDDPADKNGFDLVERLEERLGRTREPRFVLSYQIVTKAVGVAISPENAITRYHLTGAVSFALNDAETGGTVTKGVVESFTAYSATGTTVAGLAAERDAGERLMRILADQIVTRLIATAGNPAR
ncbi:MAG: LPS assembly lipoprotein LptE [Paracoccaceae bacterium]